MNVDKVVDYFYTCGLDENAGLEPLLFDNKMTGDRRRLPLSRSYKCRILQHFPEYSCGTSFDAESTSVVTMPTGLSLYTQKQIMAQSPQFPRRHSFVITREDGSRVTGVALLFPVPVDNLNIVETVCSLQDLTLAQSPKTSGNDSGFRNVHNIFQPHVDKLYTLKAFGVLSRYPFVYGLFGWLEDLWASLFLSNCETSDDTVLELAVRKILYETKLPTVPGNCITLPGVFRDHLAYYPAPGRPLKNMLDGICHLPDAIELPLFEYSLLELLTLLPTEDLLHLLTCVLMEHRIILFSTVYHRLMLVAEGVTCLLFPFTWSHVYAPILPMSLVHFVDAPVPYIMGIKQCENVSGAQSFHDCTAECVAFFELASETNVCYVYIDEGRVVIPDEIPDFPNAETVEQALSILVAASKHCGLSSKLSDCPNGYDSSSCVEAPIVRPKPPDLSRSLASFPRGLNESTSAELSKPLKQSYQQDATEKHLTEFFMRTAQGLVKRETTSEYTRLLHFNTAIRTVFLRNFVDIFRHYDNFLVPSDKSPDAQSSGLHAFDKVGFLSDQSESLLPFLSAFMETQMFASFLDQRLGRYCSPGQHALSPTASHPQRSAGVTTNLLVFDQLITKTMGEDESNPGSIPFAVQMMCNNDSDVTNCATTSQRYPLPDLLVNTTSDHCDPLGAKPGGFPPFISTRKLSENDLVVPFDAVTPFDAVHFPTLRPDRVRPPSGSNDQPKPRAKPPPSIDNRSLLPTNSAPASPPWFSSSYEVSPAGYRSTPIKRATTYGDAGTSHPLKDGSAQVFPSFAPSHQFVALQRHSITQPKVDFIDTLLNECKQKIRRMVLKKLGQEAVKLGHEDPTVCVVEENTLVSGLCDLLERIWSHGLIHKSGKSALWSHLIRYVDRHQPRTLEGSASLERHDSSSASSSHDELVVSPPIAKVSGKVDSKQKPPNLPTPSRSNFESATPRNTSSSGGRACSVGRPQTTAQTPAMIQLDWRSLAANRVRASLSNQMKSPLFKRSFFHSSSTNADADANIDLGVIFGSSLTRSSLMDDVLTVKNIQGVKTDIGFARAFVRLALEKKLLSAHLTELLYDVKLLRKLYSRYAFLRCEEEREQFLVHLLSLNAVDYYSFTRMLPQACLLYRIYWSTGRKYALSSTANMWLRLHGHLSSTPVVNLPHAQRLVDVRTPNLGLLSLLQIGHDNTGPTPRVFIEAVFVHNVTTNHLYMFPCGHWIGRGVEDDALERLLLGERIRINQGPSSDDATPGEIQQLVPRTSLSATPQRPGTLSCSDIYDRLANAINRLLRHSTSGQGRPNASPSTHLWCGRDGVIPSIQLMMQHDFKSGRLLQRRIFLWDFLVRVAANFAAGLGLFSSRNLARTPQSPMPPDDTPRYMTHSLPKPARKRTVARSRTPSLIHTSSSLSQMRDTLLVKQTPSAAQAYSQPSSPSPFRVISISTATESPQLDSTRQYSADRPSIIYFIQKVKYVSANALHLGKDGCVQRFLCCVIRERSLASCISTLASSPLTEQMFGPESFILNPDLRRAVLDLISSLDTLECVMDPILFGEG